MFQTLLGGINTAMVRISKSWAGLAGIWAKKIDQKKVIAPVEILGTGERGGEIFFFYHIIYMGKKFRPSPAPRLLSSAQKH